MGTAQRTFEDSEAVRTSVPLMVGLVGPSGGGKTYSALRLATGIQRVTGGDIYMIDTEARRGLHYADRFRFRHLPFNAPFGPLDYLAAIEHCVRKGAKVIVVDSMSHEHEGPGGVLEMHDEELTRLAGNDWGKRERMNMLAWQKPKAERRRMINTLLQLEVSALFCFRSKEKIKIQKGQDPKPLGWMPIAGEEFVYEMTVNALLLPRAGGVPTWQSSEIGERAIMKLPAQFVDLFAEARPFDEEHGAALAKWAKGDAKNPATLEMLAAISVADDAGLKAIGERFKAGRWSRADTEEIRAAVNARRSELISLEPRPSELGSQNAASNEVAKHEAATREPGDET